MKPHGRSETLGIVPGPSARGQPWITRVAGIVVNVPFHCSTNAVCSNDQHKRGQDACRVLPAAQATLLVAAYIHTYVLEDSGGSLVRPTPAGSDATEYSLESGRRAGVS